MEGVVDVKAAVGCGETGEVAEQGVEAVAQKGSREGWTYSLVLVQRPKMIALR